MITPREAHRLSTHPDAMNQFEEQIDAALREAAIGDRWPCIITIAEKCSPFAASMVTHYRAIGWSVEIIDSQRNEDPFLSFKRPTP